MNTKQPAWKAILKDAVSETDPAKAVAKTRAAEIAIFNRIGDAWPSPGFAEEQELFEALDTIRLLKSDPISCRLGSRLPPQTPEDATL
jgi:hypothetical protein